MTKKKFIPKRFLSLFLAVVMMISMLPLNMLTVAAATSTAYDGTPVTPTKISDSNCVKFGLEKGQFTGYYAIRNAKELYGYANLVNGGGGTASAVLLQDIVINETVSASGATYSWTPIQGSGSNNQFRGTFDGNGRTISGLYVNSSGSNVGLFGVVGQYYQSGGTVKNVTLANSYICGNSYVGGIAGCLNGNVASISNCKVASDVTIVGTSSDNGNINLGGIVGGWSGFSVLGSTNTCTVSKCVVLGNVNAPNITYSGADALPSTYIGAITGYANATANSDTLTVSNCYYRSGCTTYANGTYNYSMGYKYSGENNVQIASTSSSHTCVTVTHKKVSATCQYPGSSEYTFCLICDKVTSGTRQTLPVVSHDSNVKYVANANGTHHDIICVYCDTVAGTAKHTGGTAYCDAQAVCETCSTKYGDLNKTNHSNTTSFNYTYTDTQHTVSYKCCNTPIETVDHTFDGYGVCVCGYEQVVSGVAYVNREFDTSTGKVMSALKGCETYTTVTSNTTTMSTGWYVVDGTITISSRVNVSGTVHLILKDGSSLTASNGIAVNSGNSLYIYGQKEGTGTFTAHYGSGKYNAAIGGNEDKASGAIVINGGIVKATAWIGAAIGGGYGNTGNVTINGGRVTATSTNTGAAIGGGAKGSATVAINGGTIIASVNSGRTSADTNKSIGEGNNCTSAATVTLRGGSINTSNNKTNTHITNPKNGNGTSVSKREITLSGAVSVKVTAVEGLSGYDLTDVYTDANGKLYFWLPSTTELPTSITAGGKTYYNDGNGNYAAHEHSFTYKNDGDNKIVATCSDNKCDLPQVQGNGGYLTVTMPTGNQIHTGAEIKPATITYSDDWTGSKELTVSYDKNMALGTATGTLELGDAKIEVTFDIVAEIKLDANGGNGTFDPLYTNTIGELQGSLPTNVEHNSLFFNGWADAASGGNTVTGATIFKGSTTIYAQFVDHQHNWTYEKDGDNKIVARCSNEDTHCPNTDGGYVTVAQPSDLTYTGSAIEAVITNTLTTGATPNIVYSSTTDELVDGKPVYAGDYTVKIVVGDKEISLDYTIEKATPTADDFVFTAPTDLTFDYTEKAYSLKVKDGIVGMGTVHVMCYRDRTEYPAKLPGDYKLQITVGVGDNYTDAYFLKSDDWKFTISYLDTDAEAVVSGTKGSNNWYTSAVTLAAPEGYTISETVNGTYSGSVSYEAEQNKTVTYYLKDKDGYIVQRTEEIKIDLNDPTAQYKIGTDGWKQFINTISFGLFCKDYKTVEIEYSDTESSVATKQYYIASAEVTDTSKISWSDYTDTLNLNATGTYFVYMRVVDHAGREVILNSKGIVIYEDSVAVDTEVKTTYGSTNDVIVTVDLKGNTITDVKSGDRSWITDKDNACTVNGNTITLQGSYVKRLGAGTYPLTVYYAPQGVETDEVTITTTFNLVINKAKLTVKAEDKTATYGDAVPSYTVKYTGFVNGDGEVSLLGTLAFDCEYKQFDKATDYTITPKGLKSNNYEFDYQDGTLTVSPKEITVTIQKATSVYGDEIATLTADDNGGIVNNDKNVYSLATTATKTSDVDTYDITGTDTSDNYVVTFENGTKAYTITQRELTVDVVVANKKYDGLNNATITSAKLNNVANGDQIVLSSATATFASVDVANGISINLTPFSISGDKVGNYKLTQPTGITANITNGWNPAVNTEYTVSEPNSNGWLKEDLIITAKTGYVLSLTNTANGDWVNTLTGAVEGADSSVKFYVKNTTDGTISEMATANYKLDKNTEISKTTGEVQFVGRKAWQEFVNTITFNLFYKDEVTVKVEAKDALSDVAKIEYIESAAKMSLDDVKAAKNWTAMPANGVGVSVADTKQFIYYIRITDKAGNVTYLSSNGAEYDTTTPVISGVENEKIYYTTQKVTVTEKNVASIKVNGVDATAEITLDGNIDKTYTIEVVDLAENKATVTVTMKPISDLSKPIDDIDKTNVNSSDEQAVDKVKEDVAAVDKTNATDAEKEALKAIADKADELEKVIDDTKAEIARITEEMEKYDDSTVNSDDVAALEQLGKDIEKLTDGNNLTETERAFLTEDATDVAEMQQIVSDTTAENERISDKVDEYDLDTVTSDDKEDLEQLLDDIEQQLESTNLTDEEKSELNGDKTAVEDLLAKIQGTDELMDKLIGDADGYKDETVKSTDKDAIEQTIKDIDALLETENLTEEEEKALEDAKAKAESLLDTIKEAGESTETENTEKVKDVTAENVTPEDKADLEKAKEELEKALEDYSDNYTEDEKKAIEDEIKRIDDALEVIENVETVEDKIDKLPDTITKNDEEAIKAADDAYNALSDYEKSLVDAGVKKALDDAKATLAELKKPATMPNTGDNNSIWLWIAVLFVSGFGVIGTAVYGKKRKENQ